MDEGGKLAGGQQESRAGWQAASGLARQHERSDKDAANLIQRYMRGAVARRRYKRAKAVRKQWNSDDAPLTDAATRAEARRLILSQAHKELDVRPRVETQGARGAAPGATPPLVCGKVGEEVRGAGSNRLPCFMAQFLLYHPRSCATALLVLTCGLRMAQVGWHTKGGTRRAELVDRQLVWSVQALRSGVAARRKLEAIGASTPADLRMSREPVPSSQWDPPWWLAKPNRRLNYPPKLTIVTLDNLRKGPNYRLPPSGQAAPPTTDSRGILLPPAPVQPSSSAAAATFGSASAAPPPLPRPRPRPRAAPARPASASASVLAHSHARTGARGGVKADEAIRNAPARAQGATSGSAAAQQRRPASAAATRALGSMSANVSSRSRSPPRQQGRPRSAEEQEGAHYLPHPLRRTRTLDYFM